MSTPGTAEMAPDAAALATELRGLVGKLRRRLREQSNDGDLTNSQLATLIRLEKDGPSTASGLARAEGMRPQSMSAVIAPLVTQGLIAGSPDPNDGRQTLFSLTDACRHWIQEGRAARQDWLTRNVQAHLTPSERAQVAAAVELLKRLVGDASAPALPVSSNQESPT